MSHKADLTLSSVNDLKKEVDEENRKIRKEINNVDKKIESRVRNEDRVKKYLVVKGAEGSKFPPRGKDVDLLAETLRMIKDLSGIELNTADVNHFDGPFGKKKNFVEIG